ncbi:LacI family DNA-binding transcriptional regulator [Sanguibacter sp. 25GB23B1]|uniref:LacI family DNA-binding transcriptional regulator n=1 Tax=unclassified Sanguibacter TaxID=2645534 RepID=UPI0032AFB218
MRPTVKDVARRAGVSPKTVSNVINGQVFVRPETKARVEAALEEMAYVPNLSARALRNGRSGVVALALPDLSTPYSAETAHHFVEVAHERGWAIQIEETGTGTGAGSSREWHLLSRARAHLVDGLILNPVALAGSAISGAGPLPPMVLIGEVEQDRVDQVWVDSVAAARDMTAHLVAGGHRRIAVVGAPGALDHAAAHLRVRGYRLALDEAGIGQDRSLEIVCDDWSPDGAALAVRDFLARHPLPDAIFCFTDSMAIGTLGVLWAAGRTVPAEVSVAGFDDIADGRHAVPPLTTVSFDKRAFAERAFTMLESRMSDPTPPARRVTIDHTLVTRESTSPGPAPARR